ncbi:Spc19-domain-containing protein [Gymnopilus junonius]|uniref:DASH complex subunit SPC19 n=1 Tax=Gymnopilus junonius TaxID=109634 RepID=A0A9P5ND41_GYMJU|nr:Spc19-domain-containing protein [Gymnopilus junonius]
MSRLSRANLRARDSIFSSRPEQYIGDIQARCPPDLEECVMAMEDCCEEAYEAQVLLRNGTKDLPRMNKVLQNERVFLLVNEDTIKRYKRGLADEIEPAISELIERAEQGLALLERKAQTLQAKVENVKNIPKHATGTSAVHKIEARRLQSLVKQREKLEADVRAMEEEILQKKAKKTRF